MKAEGGERVMVVSRGRRVRRGRSVLPLRTTHHRLSHTISCWYCDFKISALNDILFSFGRKHARILRIWFSIGIGFGLTALLSVTLILLWESSTLLHLYNGNVELTNLSNAFLFSVPGFSMSPTDAGYIIFSTLISVAVHEFGHAVSAASEGIQIEYIAVFLAVLFPGALVAFDYELLQSLPQFNALRVYCAGIWHNAVCCAACALALFILPLILYPFYMHGENPMVFDITPTSPLSGYLSLGDVIVSLDGLQVHEPAEWMDRMTVMNEWALQNSHHIKDSRNFRAVTSRKGYCIPSSWVEDNKKMHLEDDQSTCPDELTLFSSVPCFNSSLLDDGGSDDGHWKRKESRHCLSAKDVVQLKKCGNGWLATVTSGSRCMCSEDESCLVPVLISGLTWVEIMYTRPYSSECLWFGRNSSVDFESPDSGAANCGGTFVFIGDVVSMAKSIQLTAYRPRWAFILGVHLPSMLEKMLAYTFNVSLTLALLNSLPVFFLDGESILEVTLGCITLLNPRKRGQVLQLCLVGGSLLSVLAFLRLIFSIFL